MRHVLGGEPADRVPDGGPAGQRARNLVDETAALLATPGLVVLHGGPGAGRSGALRRLAEAFRGPVFAGGALATLQSVPAFALSRALRVRLPAGDPALLAEAVRARVRGGLLILDDLQWADPDTVAVLAPLAAHCRVAAALRTPHRLPADTVAALRRAAAGWLPVPPLDVAAATVLARATAPGLDPANLARVVRRAGGVPLAVTALARHAERHRAASGGDGSGGNGGSGGAASGGDGVDEVGYAVAAALADLTRPARTALAALGLLGRPAPAALLGPGVEELTGAGLVTAAASVSAVSPYVAEVAAGLLDDAGRRALHRRLADLVPPAEAARHLAAAGDGAAAYRRAVAAAATAGTGGERAELLLLACGLPGVDPRPDDRLAAARAALASGRPGDAARVLAAAAGPAAAALRAEALLQSGDLPAARAAAETVPPDAAGDLLAARDRVLLLARLAGDPAAAADAATRITARHGPQPAHAGLRAALAAVRAATRAAGWEYALASAAAAAGAGGDPLAARWSAWLLVDTLAADGRLAEAARSAESAAAACAADLAYSWQTRFLAVRWWCAALSGDVPPDEVLRRAGDLADRSLPALARGYAVAAVSLVEADGGLLAPARARLAAEPPAAASAGPVLDWVRAEAAWLDGQPARAAAPGAPPGRAPLIDGLARITARWAAHDGATTPPPPPAADASAPPPVRQTLAAWASPERFAAAAATWRGLAVREEVRCLLAHGLHAGEAATALPALLAAERLAERAGLVVLLGRVHRALRRHAVRREGRGPRSGGDLTHRERDVLRLVAAGDPTRRIAGQLGISAETVETHIRSGLRKLGARTRTEAAALVLERIGAGPVPAPRRPPAGAAEVAGAPPPAGDGETPVRAGGPAR